MIPDISPAERFTFREIDPAVPAETERAVEIEQICFPPHEACSRAHMLERMQAAPECFLLAVEKRSGKIAGFLNGIAVNEDAFRDEFFTDASLHDPAGRRVMIAGLDVLPEFRQQGLATELMRRYAQAARERGREALVLTCLDDKVGMYEKMGYRDLGLANSAWGGEAWHEMILTL